jgi:positive regulator of sigma E activity
MDIHKTTHAKTMDYSQINILEKHIVACALMVYMMKLVR